MHYSKTATHKPLCQLLIILPFHESEIKTNSQIKIEVEAGKAHRPADLLKTDWLETQRHFHSLRSTVKAISQIVPLFYKWAPPTIVEVGTCGLCQPLQSPWTISRNTVGKFELWLKHHKPLGVVVDLHDRGTLTLMVLAVQARVINNKQSFRND